MVQDLARKHFGETQFLWEGDEKPFQTSEAAHDPDYRQIDILGGDPPSHAPARIPVTTPAIERRDHVWG